MGLVANAPAKIDLWMLYSGYGTVMGAVSNGKARVWLLAESDQPDAAMKLLVGTNDPQTGWVVYHELGAVADAKIQGGRSITVTLADGQTLMQTMAPCVCGAGAVGMAGPTEERHRVMMLDPRSHQGVTYQ